MTTTAPTTPAPLRLREHWALPTWVIADDPATLARAARVLSEHGLCVMELPDGGDLPAGAGIPAVVSSVEVLDLGTGETHDMAMEIFHATELTASSGGDAA